jgi:hypothetical protein
MKRGESVMVTRTIDRRQPLPVRTNLKLPPRCECGHHKALHWEYSRMEGCSHQVGRRITCQCRGYRPVSISLVDALAELFHCVAACERDWTLMDRIDLAVRTSQRPLRMRTLSPVTSHEGVNHPKRRFE